MVLNTWGGPGVPDSEGAAGTALDRSTPTTLCACAWWRRERRAHIDILGPLADNKVALMSRRTVDSHTSAPWSSRSRLPQWSRPSPAPRADLRSTGDAWRSAARSEPALSGPPGQGISVLFAPATAVRRTGRRDRLQTLSQTPRPGTYGWSCGRCRVPSRSPPGIGRRFNAGTPPPSRSRSTISSPPQAPSEPPMEAPERSEPEQHPNPGRHAPGVRNYVTVG